MQNILRKRILRDLKENVFRYLALALLIILGMYIVIGLVGAAETIIKGTAQMAKNNNVENGQFGMFIPLTKEEKTSLEDKGVTLEEHFYLDYILVDDSVLRVFSNREKIDLVHVECGSLPTEHGEILLERRYCEEHAISPGDKIRVGNMDFTVVGTGTVPDYETSTRNFSDSAVDSYEFGIGFVTEEDYRRIKSKGESVSSEEYCYAYLLNGTMSDRQLKEQLQDLEIAADDIDDSFLGSIGRKWVEDWNDFKYASLSKMTRFVSASDNPRIGSAADDKFVDKAAGLAAGVIVLILFAYVISVFTVHSIEKESGVIGTFYAMGVKRKELLQHYLTLPVAVTFVSGVIGTVLGYSSFGVAVQLSEPYGYFSIPSLHVIYEPYLLVYGLLMPPLAAAVTNYLVIGKKLNRPALALIRGEKKGAKVNNMQIKGGFVHIFQIRQFLRERRTAGTVFLGMFISLLIVMLSLNCYTLCSHIKTDNVRDTKFEYMYTYKYPEETVPNGGEEAYGVTMKKETLGYNFDVTLLGIHEDNPYFAAQVRQGESRVLISSALAQKYAVDKGDILTLFDEENDRYYAFSVDGIVTYSTGFFVFMDIDSMRELMGQEEDYYNIVFANHALDIDSDRLYYTLSKEDVKKSSSVFVAQMKTMIITLLVVSILIFTVVMYLMMKVMIDRSSMPISLFKVFGYRRKEIKRLYLNGNFIVVLLSAVLGIPLSKVVMDAMYPFLVANIACGLNLSFSWQLYAGIILGVLVLYVIINRMLMFRVNRILPAEVLKNRE